MTIERCEEWISDPGDDTLIIACNKVLPCPEHPRGGRGHIVADQPFPTEKLGPSFAAISDDDYPSDELSDEDKALVDKAVQSFMRAQGVPADVSEDEIREVLTWPSYTDDDPDERPEGWPIGEDMMIVPVAEFHRLQDFYSAAVFGPPLGMVEVPVGELQRLQDIEEAARAYVASDPPRSEWKALCAALGIEQHLLSPEDVEKVAATVQMLMGPVDGRIRLLEVLLSPPAEDENDYLQADAEGNVNPTWGGGTLSYNPSEHDDGPDWDERDRNYPSDAT